MDIYGRIKNFKKEHKVSNDALGQVLGKTGDAVRKSLSRKSLSDLESQTLEDFMDRKADYGLRKDESEAMVNDPTGYYYPDVSASAGLEMAFENSELTKIPVSIPNFGHDIDFINVFGDSMYPKFCSGEIIGIKEVEPKYLNYGYAYVVVFNDGQVFLKYIKKGKDENHWLLVSENEKYEPKEYHLKLIKKIYIIKGVITKTTM